jgi:hypothetical protein
MRNFNVKIRTLHKTKSAAPADSCRFRVCGTGQCSTRRLNLRTGTKDLLLRRCLCNRLRRRGGASRLVFFVAAESRDPLTLRLRIQTFAWEANCGSLKSKSAPFKK